MLALQGDLESAGGLVALNSPLARAHIAEGAINLEASDGTRLQYTLDLPEALRQVPVPPLLLQPLVENAIRHGLEPKVEGGEIRVSARRVSAADGARLVLEVADTGIGLADNGGSAPREDGGGFGVQQVRDRLHTLYGDRAAMELIAAPAGGTRSTVTFPM